MKEFINNLAALIKVKTIVTLALTAVFCFLSAVGVIAEELFMTVYTVVISFYFGTQYGKKAKKTE